MKRRGFLKGVLSLPAIPAAISSASAVGITPPFRVIEDAVRYGTGISSIEAVKGEILSHAVPIELLDKRTMPKAAGETVTFGAEYRTMKSFQNQGVCKWIS